MALDVVSLYLLNDLAGRSSLLDQIIVFFGSYLPYLVVIVFIIQLLISGYAKREKWRIFFVTLFSVTVAHFGVVELIRFFYHRPRPFLALPVHQLLTDSAWSFPSGHAAFFFALAMAAYLYGKRRGIGFFIAAICISLARVAAGVHYPSDILFGALIGILVAYATFIVVRKITGKGPIATY